MANQTPLKIGSNNIPTEFTAGDLINSAYLPSSGGGLSYAAITADPGPAVINTLYEYNNTTLNNGITFPSASSNSDAIIGILIGTSTTQAVFFNFAWSSANSYASGAFSIGGSATLGNGNAYFFLSNGTTWRLIYMLSGF